MVKFMKHDGWEKALFCHWKISPEELQPLLPEGLLADLTPDGSAWIGLVLLTERGVGPSEPLRACTQRCFDITHLGANIRTYVRGPKGPGEGVGRRASSDLNEEELAQRR